MKAPGTHAPAAARIADGQLWSDLASAVDTDPPADGFQIPKYHRKKAVAVKAAPAESHRTDEEAAASRRILRQKEKRRLQERPQKTGTVRVQRREGDDVEELHARRTCESP